MPWLKYTLEMMKNQSRQDFELICVDSGSTDGSWELLQSTKSAKIYQIDPQDYIPGKVLNQAISHAQGEYIVFNNADCVPQNAQWLENLIHPLENDHQLIAVFANQIPRSDAFPPVKRDYQRAFGDGKIAATWRHFFSLASSAIRTEIIRKYPFDERIQYSEDIEWSWRMKQKGYRIGYVPDSMVEHSHNYTLKQLKTRFTGEGRAEAYIYHDIYANKPIHLSFFRTVIVAAFLEIIRDWVYIAKHGHWEWLVKTKIIRLYQRYYAWKGRIQAYRELKTRKGILISCLAFDDGKSGISEYIVSTTREFLKTHDVTLLIHPSDRELFPLSAKNLRFVEIPEFLKKPQLSMAFHLFVLPWWKGLKRYDLVFLPAANRRLFCRFPANTIVTFHDLSQLHIPGKYDVFRMFYIRYIVGHYIHKAPHIFAISESTKYDLRRFFGVPGKKIEVNYNGYDPDKLKNPIPQGELQRKYGIKGEFILYVARIEHPGKNHLNLLKAYEYLPLALREKYELVCAGSIWNGGETVTGYWHKMPDRHRVHFPGFVSGGDLAALYKYSSLYVFPSFYEGFGLPMLDAFACGTPVICANTSSLPEIGKKAVLTFNPHKAQDIAAAMQSVLDNPALANQLIEKAYKRLEDFSWQRHCKRLLQGLAKSQD